MHFATSTLMRRVVCAEVTLRGDHRELLHDFSWTHSPPGIAWLTGANGSGKSSLLRALAGWQRPALGSITWAEEVHSLRYYAPVMHASPELRVGDFLAFMRRIESVETALGVDALLPARVAANQRFGRVSTGEAKRLLLWALLRAGDGPLVLDEPYEHLSREAKQVLTDLLRARAETQVVIIATNQEVPAQAGDVILTLDDESVEVRNGAA